MRELKSVIEANSYSPRRENWVLSNKLKVTLFWGSKYCEIGVSSDTGSVTDQVYEKLKTNKIFPTIKLGGVACPLIHLDKDLVEDFFNFIETIDAENLEHGKTY
jgi:hypothetical protein